MRVQRGKIARELAELEEQVDRAFERVLRTRAAYDPDRVRENAARMVAVRTT